MIKTVNNSPEKMKNIKINFEPERLSHSFSRTLMEEVKLYYIISQQGFAYEIRKK